MRRRIVIHNHLPVRARDGGPGSGPQSGGGGKIDPKQKWAVHLSKGKKGGRVIAYVDAPNQEAAAKVAEGKHPGHKANTTYLDPYYNKDAAEPRPGDPDYKRWVEQQREEQNKRGGKFQANDLTRYQGDVIWIDVPEAQYNKLSMGSQIKVHGFTAMVIEKDIVPTRNGPNPRAKVRLQKPDAHDWGKRDSVGVVNREAEDRNRDKIYREAGIRRV